MAKIAIDIDETISSTNKAMIKYYQKHIDPNLQVNPFFSAKTNSEKLDTIHKFHKLILEEDIDFVDPIEGAKETIEKLDKTNKLYLITARHISLVEKTNKWVQKYFENIFFEDIQHLEYTDMLGVVKDKDEICKEIGIDVIIDDSLENALKCSKINIPVILFDLDGNYSWNKSETPLPNNIYRVKNWDEAYKILNEKFNIF